MKLKKVLCFIVTLVLLTCTSIPVYAADTVATIKYKGNTTSFTSFSTAWEKACTWGKSGVVEFTLCKDWIGDENGNLGTTGYFRNGALNYSSKYRIYIDLNGYMIDRNLFKMKDSGAVIYNWSLMTIKDSRSDEYTCSTVFKGGAIAHGANSERGGGIVTCADAKLEFLGGTILDCISTADGGGMCIDSQYQHVTINGGSFYGNRTYDSNGECRGGALYIEQGTVDVKNATFYGNYAEDNGGAISMQDNATLTCTNCTFSSNSAKEEGGAVFIGEDSKVNMEDCTFLRNKSTGDDGGAVFCDSELGTYFYNCNMYYNYSGSEGGAMHINDDKVFVIGGNYQYNSAKDCGGGIYVDSMDDINAAGKLVIQDNKVDGKEDDLCLQDGTATTAHLYCGGFYPGSSIYICTSNRSSDSKSLLIKNIEKYQYKNYIHYDSGFAEKKVDESSESSEGIRAQASVFSTGNIIFICVCFAVFALLIVFTVLYAKKRKGAKKNDEE